MFLLIFIIKRFHYHFFRLFADRYFIISIEPSVSLRWVWFIPFNYCFNISPAKYVFQLLFHQLLFCSGSTKTYPIPYPRFSLQEVSLGSPSLLETPETVLVRQSINLRQLHWFLPILIFTWLCLEPSFQFSFCCLTVLLWSEGTTFGSYCPSVRSLLKRYLLLHFGTIHSSQIQVFCAKSISCLLKSTNPFLKPLWRLKDRAYSLVFTALAILISDTHPYIYMFRLNLSSL